MLSGPANTPQEDVSTAVFSAQPKTFTPDATRTAAGHATLDDLCHCPLDEPACCKGRADGTERPRVGPPTRIVLK